MATPYGKNELSIYDMLGKMVYQGSFTEQKIELELGFTGIYLIDINGKIQRKVVIERY